MPLFERGEMDSVADSETRGFPSTDALPRFLAARPVVLFDFDGTVVDSQRGILRVASEIIRRRGLPQPSHERMLLMVGPPLEEGFSLVCGVDDATALEMAGEYRRLFDEILRPEDYPVFPGMRELIDAIVASGRRVAVATSRMEDTAQRMVAEQRLTQFSAVCGRVAGLRDTKADSIRAALAALDAEPGDAVMVGDRENDDLGAREAGVPCIGIYNGAAKPGEHEAAGAAVSVHSVGDLARVLGVELEQGPKKA